MIGLKSMIPGNGIETLLQQLYRLLLQGLKSMIPGNGIETLNFAPI